MEEPAQENAAAVCPRCGTPLRPHMPFCDHCGARVTPPPACTLCGTLLEPNSRFCPSCGTMIGASADQKREHERSSEDMAGAPGTGAGSGTRFRGMKSRWRNRAAITIPPGIRALISPSVLIGRYGGAALILAALILIATGVYTLGNPLVPGHTDSVVVVTPLETQTAVAVTTIPTTAPAITPEETGSTVSLVPGPVDVPPENLRITLQTERDPRSFIVSVMFMGGKGQYGVRDILARLTRSDGQVLEKTFRPVQVGSGVELQGTQKTDRLEVIARYHNGEEYKLVDQVFEYRIRN